MKKIKLSLLASVIIFASNVIYATPPENLSCAKREVISYYDSGSFEKDVDVIEKNAEAYLHKRVNDNNLLSQPKKLAMVLDIDDTSLSNFLSNKKHDFGSSTENINDSYRKAKSPAIKPILKLYNEAIKNGVTVFFITFRPDEFRSYTVTNLQNEGYYGWAQLYMPNNDEIKQPAQKFKTNLRETITNQGYDIILNLGDQESDIMGGYADQTYRVPNPLYWTAPTCPTKSCEK